MKSDMPKGLFEVCGMPMVELVGRAMKSIGIDRPIIVIGHEGEKIKERLGDSYDYVWQKDQLGTGHAVFMADDRLSNFPGSVVVAPADIPLLDDESLQQLVHHHQARSAQCTIGTCRPADPTGYGRIIRDAHGRALKIVEEKDAHIRQKGIGEVNTGVYCFNAQTLFATLPRLLRDNAQGEMYLTDCVHIIHDGGGIVETRVFHEAGIVQGVNDRWQLAEASTMLRNRIIREVCESGVTILDPQTTYIDFDVEIGKDTLIHPMTVIRAGTNIGEGCEIGPHALIERSEIGNRTSVNMSRVNGSTIGSGVKIGPFAHIRPGSMIGDNCKIGNFVEIKKAQLDEAVSASHLSYIGDATIGTGANIGAGTITCNYDGYNKHQTVIGANSFVGSNSTIVAPVTIGENAFIAAGSVITHDVPNEALGVGRARQENKEGWAQNWRKRMKSD